MLFLPTSLANSVFPLYNTVCYNWKYDDVHELENFVDRNKSSDHRTYPSIVQLREDQKTFWRYSSFNGLIQNFILWHTAYTLGKPQYFTTQLQTLKQIRTKLNFFINGGWWPNHCMFSRVQRFLQLGYANPLIVA